MRACIVVVLALVVLAACGPSAQRVRATAPTVTFSYQNAAEFDAAAEQADEWCDDRYDAEARLIDRWPANNEATFRCVPD
jgi:hypothetical protein